MASTCEHCASDDGLVLERGKDGRTYLTRCKYCLQDDLKYEEMDTDDSDYKSGHKGIKAY